MGAVAPGSARRQIRLLAAEPEFSEGDRSVSHFFVARRRPGPRHGRVRIKRRGAVRPGAPPAERILERARRLFYEEGFRTTGVDRIIAESGASKKSFYRHYPSKTMLAAAYLRAERDELVGFFEDLASRHAAYPDFVRAWCGILRKQAR